MNDLFSQPDLIIDIIPDKPKIKKPKPKIIVNIDFFKKQNKLFLENSKSNPFYDKNIYFTQGLKGDKYRQFQLLGNLGAWADDDEFSIETDFYIISDLLMKDLENDPKHKLFCSLYHRINVYLKVEKGIFANYKYEKLQFISESTMHKHVLKRCNEIGDINTKELIPK